MLRVALVMDGDEPQLDVEQILADLPENVTVADTVDLDSPDPSWLPETERRQCIAARQRDSARCTSAPMRTHLLCTVHAGLLDSAAGGRKTAERRREARERAEDRVAMRRLGTRAAIQAVLAEKQEKVRRTVSLLLDDASDSSLPPSVRRQAALAVLPYVDQALGRPTERVEHAATSANDVAAMDTASLQALVAQGRAQRLAAVPDVDEHEQTG